MVRRSASGVKVRDGVPREARPRYQKELSSCRMPLEYDRLPWRCFLADGTDLKAVPKLVELDVLTKPASPTAHASMSML